MIRHYFLLSIRSILRNKVFSLINVTGLAVGFIAFVLIAQYVSYETGFDRFHEDYEKLYRVVQEKVENKEVVERSAISFAGVRQLLRDNFPDVTTTGMLEIPIDLGITYRRNGEAISFPGRMIQADSMFFRVFSNMLIEGDPGTALKDPRAIVLSEKLSRATFGDEKPLSKPLGDIADLDANDNDFSVKGVFRDLPVDSHFHFEAVTQMDQYWDTIPNHWNVASLYTYVRLTNEVNAKDIESRLNGLLESTAVTFPGVKGTRVALQPITDINLQPGISADLAPRTDVRFPWILGAVALGILFIAWINYINLETARFITHAQEVGIRRVIGSTRVDLALQFMTRYFCLNAIALALALVGILLIVPHFSYLTGVPISELNFSHFEVWRTALGLYVAGTIVTGVLPILLLLKLNPAAIIKGTPNTGATTKLRTSLVVAQYVTSISLIVFVAIAGQQLDFMKQMDKKVDVDQVLAIENSMAYTGLLENSFEAFSNELKTNPAIKDVSSSSNVPGREINFTLVNEIKRNQADPFDPTRYKLLFIDYDYIPLYGLKLKAGRNYLPSEAAEDNTGRIILNEAAIRALGFKNADEAIHQYIYFPLWAFMKPRIEIVGIIEDHHHRAIKETVEPTIYFLNMARFQQVYYSVRFDKNADLQQATHFVETSYKKLFPKYPFNYFFVDDVYQKQFDPEVHFARVFGMFSAVASLLACLGIVGITLFETNTRLKEISIRKVLGASAAGIVALLSKNNVKVVIISLLVAVPAAYYASSQWLSTYPVRIDLDVMPFVTAAVSITLLTCIASAAQTFKAAQSNPVNHLKNE